MTRKSKITKKELAAVLRESVFAPNKPGPLKVIVDVGDPRYFMQRALELIILSLQSPTVEQKRDYLGDAITLLGVAKHTLKEIMSKEIMKGKLTQEQMNTLVDERFDSLRITEQVSVPDKREIAGDPY